MLSSSRLWKPGLVIDTKGLNVNQHWSCYSVFSLQSVLLICSCSFTEHLMVSTLDHMAGEHLLSPLFFPSAFHADQPGIGLSWLSVFLRSSCLPPLLHFPLPSISGPPLPGFWLILVLLGRPTKEPKKGLQSGSG